VGRAKSKIRFDDGLLYLEDLDLKLCFSLHAFKGRISNSYDNIMLKNALVGLRAMITTLLGFTVFKGARDGH